MAYNAVKRAAYTVQFSQTISHVDFSTDSQKPHVIAAPSSMALLGAFRLRFPINRRISALVR